MVKGEIGGCDLVAVKPGEPPVVVVGELKMRFNLELILQAVDRAPACDEVWIAARVALRGAGRESDAKFRNLCRRLGFGMLDVTDAGGVDIMVSPAAPMPRRDLKRRSRLVEEHASGRSPALLRSPQSAIGGCSARCALEKSIAAIASIDINNDEVASRLCLARPFCGHAHLTCLSGSNVWNKPISGNADSRSCTAKCK